MSYDDTSSFAGFLFNTLFFIAFLAWIGYLSHHFFNYYQLAPDDWQCTASVVVNDTLPREEVCTQYTRKGEP